jgi:hypothetical protein
LTFINIEDSNVNLKYVTNLKYIEFHHVLKLLKYKWGPSEMLSNILIEEEIFDVPLNMVPSKLNSKKLPSRLILEVFTTILPNF